MLHAKSIWNGESIRKGWPLADRLKLLHEIMQIPQTVKAALAYAMVRRGAPTPSFVLDRYGARSLSIAEFQHATAFETCLTRIDQYLAHVGEDSNLRVFAEDVPRMKAVLVQAADWRRQNPVYMPTEWMRSSPLQRPPQLGSGTKRFQISRPLSIEFKKKAEEPIL